MQTTIAKIRKLLALSQSPNESEAKAALTKARTMMARHKITEAELGELKDQKVTELRTGIRFTAGEDLWINELAQVIAANTACESYALQNGSGFEAVFAGMPDDVRAAEAMMDYAVRYVRFYSYLAADSPGAADRRDAVYSYGCGFAAGLSRSLSEIDPDLGAVMSVPEEVREFAEAQTGESEIDTVCDLNEEGWAEGFLSGRSYQMPEAELHVAQEMAGYECTDF